ncbi:hypothetical protein HaLaN_15913, partial [Haematococcus lacustris]
VPCHRHNEPRGTDQRRGRVVLVDEHRTSRVSSAVNGQQPCESRLSKRRATRPADWKPPAGQVEQRLMRPAWSQQRDQPVRGLMWCPVVAPRKPPQAPRSSQEATQTAASEPGPSTPQPAKRSKRTKAEPAAEPTKGKGKGKAAKAKPAPQPGRWLDRDCNVRTAAETPRDLAASTNYDPIGLGPLQTAAARIKTTGIQQTPSDTQMSKSDNWKAHGPSLDQNTLDAHVPEEAVAQAHVHVEIPPIPPATLQTDAGNGQTRPSARHQRNASNTSTYDVDDLDSDWQNLLDNVWSHACLQPGNSFAIAKCTALTRLIVVGGCPSSARWAASHAPSGATSGCSQACSSDWDSWCGVCLGSSSGGDRQVPFMECGSPQTSSLAIACRMQADLMVDTTEASFLGQPLLEFCHPGSLTGLAAAARWLTPLKPSAHGWPQHCTQVLRVVVLTPHSQNTDRSGPRVAVVHPNVGPSEGQGAVSL